jgi:SAM-dependent methyltransferase
MRLALPRRRPRYPIPPARLRFMGETDAEFIEIGDGLVDQLERYAGLGSDSRVLDIGCGYGRVAHALLRRRFTGRYVGIDILERQIEWCAAKLGREGVEFRRVDVRNDRYNPQGADGADALDLAGETFEVVALFSVFTHMWPSDVTAYLAKIAAALEPGGRALATFFLLDAEWRRLEAAGAASFRLPFERTPFCRYGSEEEPLHRVGYELDWVRSAAADAGLALVGGPAFGGWSGRAGAAGGDAGYQDAVVFARAGDVA